MKYTKEEVLQYIKEEDVKFVRLAFCDVFGRQKNVSVMADELSRAFRYGIAIDGSAIAGFGDETHSDLLLHPDPETLALLPWRPEHGRVVRMYSYITYPDGRPFECDTRAMLKNAIDFAESKGYSFFFGAEQEFYLFKLDEDGVEAAAVTAIMVTDTAYIEPEQPKVFTADRPFSFFIYTTCNETTAVMFAGEMVE